MDGIKKKGNYQNSHDPSAQSSRRFEEACEMMRKNPAKFSDLISESSSSEDEDTDFSVVDKICSTYDEDEDKNLQIVREYLQDIITSGAIVCLICLEAVKRSEKIWSCQNCYCVLHLYCIQKWAKDSLYHLSNNSDEKNKILKWSCPKCRWDYAPSDKPLKYLCFCKKVENPCSDSWSLPHSCGKFCDKKLKPDCGHCCCLLCHPGPCPPCPKTVSVSCCCSKSKAVPKRCSDKEWLCGQKCSRRLSCDIHLCEELCHKNSCPPCKRQSFQKCQCGRNSVLRPCFDPIWQCDKRCKKSLECGHHSCKLVCHSGPCPPCPYSGPRFCPCEKKSVVLPCTENVLPCGDTCNKLLNCGLHHCSQRCHYGPCETCIQMRLMKCRCGQREKSVPCCKEFVCEIKCKKRRDCGRHNCNKKCCVGNCPPCEAICGKTLNCGTHKCSSLCHPGPCYPCREKVDINCNCGTSKIVVPCGSKKSTVPPKCLSDCKLPADCHHPERHKHKCHYGKCPSCRLTCSKTLQCGHICPAKCHSAVLTKYGTKKKMEGPWDLVNAYKFELVSKPCPPCLELVSVTCLGGHETGDIPCSNAKPVSCGKKCGRCLTCGNHTCNLECHKVKCIKDLKQSEDCESCSVSCQRSRKKDCTHPCLRPCHPGSCSPCKQNIKMKCHCGINVVYVICDEWNSVDESKKKDFLSCSNRCPKEMQCGHRCISPCHSGDCADRKSCKKKVMLRCPCKRIKKEIQCFLLLNKNINIECNQECIELQNSLRAIELEKANEKEAEMKRQQERELHEFLKKTEGKRKRKKKHNEMPDHTKRISPIIILGTSVVLCILAIITYFCM